MSELKLLYEKYGKSVYRFLLRLTGDESLAEDLLQETFYQAFVHIGQFRGQSSIYTWLCQIGKNAWLRECRRRNWYSDAALHDLVLPDPSPTPEESFIEKESLQNIRRAMLRLEKPYRDIFILHVLGGLKLSEIAHTYGKSESWARVTYHRAKNKIAEEVKK